MTTQIHEDENEADATNRPASCDSLRIANDLTVIRGDCFGYSFAADLIIADPPYGKILKAKWDVACYQRLEHWIAACLKPGGTAFVWGGIGTRGNRPFFRWLSGFEGTAGGLGSDVPNRLQLWDLITWRKRRAYGCPDRLLFTREECAMLVKGEKPATFHVPYLEKLRGYEGYNKEHPAKDARLRRTNVWDDVTELFKGKIHEAEKPSRLAEIMIEMSSNPGELVVDPMAGSGSTGVAALRLGRRCVLIEKSDCPMRVQ